MKDSFFVTLCVPRPLFVNSLRFYGALLLGVCAFLLGVDIQPFNAMLAPFAYAQQDEVPDIEPDTTQEMERPTGQKSDSEQVEALKNSLNKFLDIKPPVLRLSAFNSQQKKALESALQDSKALMELAPSQDQRLWAVELRLRALLAHARIKAPDSFSQLREMNELATLLKNSEDGKGGKYDALLKQMEYGVLLFSIGMINTDKGDAPNPYKVKAAVIKFIKENPKQINSLALPLVQAAKIYFNRNRDFTLETLKELSKTYYDTGFIDDRKQAEKLLNMAKRFEMIGSQMTIKGVDIQGQPISLLNYRGKVVLVDFYAAWCLPCVAELPKLQDIYKKYHPKNFEIIGISADNSEKEALKFVHERKISWRIIFDSSQESGGKLTQQLGIDSYPTMMLVGRNGKVIATDFDLEMLQKELEKLTFGYTEPSGFGRTNSFASPTQNILAPDPLLGQ